jgi:hypothetical protein
MMRRGVHRVRRDVAGVALASLAAMSDTPPHASAGFVRAWTRRSIVAARIIASVDMAQPRAEHCPACRALAWFMGAKAMAFVKTIRSISDLRARVLARLGARWRQTVINQIIEDMFG